MNKKDSNSRRVTKLKLIKLLDEVEEIQKVLDSPFNLFTEIENYSDVCIELNIKEKKESDFDSIKEFAIHQILNIQKLFNGDSTTNYWYPWFKVTSSGLAFVGSFSYVGGGCFVGRVALYKDKETSDFIGNQEWIRKIYNNLR